MRSNKDTVAMFQMVNGMFLEGVELERILNGSYTLCPTSLLSWTYLVSHMGHFLVKVMERTGYVDDMGPISFGSFKFVS
jgi:hypothetical protein